MPGLNKIADTITISHKNALTWFIEHRGQEVGWPAPLSDGTYLVNRPKGIHKPRGWKYALSVRQMREGPYADAEPALQSDGSWHYQYFQEGTDPAQRDHDYTNVALMACIEDGVPIGVLRQTSKKPDVRYKVMGLAWVRQWRNDGYFILDGLSPQEESFSLIANDVIAASEFDPTSIEDARKRIESSIVQRQGQGEFRARLLNIYQGRCAVTGCDASSALEAAHIVPYRGRETNLDENGILLRADIHTLFDLGLIAIDSSTMTIVLSPTLSGGHYSLLAGKSVSTPRDPACHPSKEAIDVHREAAGL